MYAVRKGRINEITPTKPTTKQRGHGVIGTDWVFIVMQKHTRSDIGLDDTDVIASCSSLGEANWIAHQCLEDQLGFGIEWDEFEEHLDDRGCVSVKAKRFEYEKFEVWIKIKSQERRAATASREPRKGDQVDYVYIVRTEFRNNVCGSNEEGEIETVDIDTAFKELEAANAHVRSSVEESTEDREELEVTESSAGGLLRMDVLDLNEGEMTVYEVVQQRVR